MRPTGTECPVECFAWRRCDEPGSDGMRRGFEGVT